MEDELTELQRLFPGARAYEEGGVHYYLLPNLRLPVGCTPTTVDALLCPILQDGYPSRLYFAQRRAGPVERNWNAQQRHILGRTWEAFSWDNVRGRRLADLVLAHVRGLLP